MSDRRKRDSAAYKKYQREYKAARRAAYLADKSCLNCGSTEDLEIHHVDPSTKDARLKPGSSLWGWSAERRAVELAKCCVLCFSCHKAETARQRARPLVHGTYAGYHTHGCRCGPCRGANATHSREWRLRA